MVATNAPSPRQPAHGHSKPERSEFGFDDPATMTVKELIALRKQSLKERAAEARRRQETERELADALAQEQAGEQAEQVESRDPSPAEIAARCAEIRKGWSNAEHRRRAAGNVWPVAADSRILHRLKGSRTWQPPVCRMATVRKGVSE